MSVDRGRLHGAQGRLLRGYGPLLARIVAFTLMVALVPTVARERVVVRSVVDRTGSSGAAPDASGTAAGAQGPGQTGSAAAAGARRGRTGRALTASGGAAATVTGCPDREEQVPGDPYSPPCVAFSGDNGGATWRGVTGDSILLALRISADPVSDYQSVIAQLAGADVTETPEDFRRTGEALLEYFNRNFQLYGRKIKIAQYQGRGSLAREFLGGGQEQANADAIKVASEVRAFADLSGFSQPYADALTRQRVMAFGVPYMSREWFLQRRPYAWSLAPDCTTLAEFSAEFGSKRLFGKPAAHAGGDLRDKPRRVAVIAPDNPEYQQCVDTAVKLLEKDGHRMAARLAYSLDLSSFSNQAASMVARLKSEKITSVACACDPLLPVLLTGKAYEQGYLPEWLVMGTALTDADIVGQLYNQEGWARAFGMSALGDQMPRRAGPGYHAYKTIRNDEPSLAVEILYFHFYLTVVGLQMAGPNLTPETFEAGMFAYPGGMGLAGVWQFGPGRYTPQRAAREIWWDPNRTSAYNNKKGAYVIASDWWRPGEVPPGDPRASR